MLFALLRIFKTLFGLFIPFFKIKGMNIFEWIKSQWELKQARKHALAMAEKEAGRPLTEKEICKCEHKVEQKIKKNKVSNHIEKDSESMKIALFLLRLSNFVILGVLLLHMFDKINLPDGIPLMLLEAILMEMAAAIFFIFSYEKK